MSATQSASRAPDPAPIEAPSDAGAGRRPPSERDLLIADHALVQRQNVHWLSHRLNFHAGLAALLEPRSGRVAALDEAYADPMSRMPTWRRWVLLLQRAAGGDPTARERIRTALRSRLAPGRHGGPGPRPVAAPDSIAIDEETYAAWVKRYDPLSAIDRAALALAAADPALPSVLVLLRVDPASAALLPDRVAELAGQMHVRWRAALLLADGLGADDERVVAALRADGRLALGPARAEAERLCVVVEGDATLRPETLLTFALASQAAPAAQLIYADEDRIGADGVRQAPRFKPEFSPELNRRTGYLGGCVAAAPALLRAHPPGGETVAAWTRRAAGALSRPEVVHVPRILFHRPAETPEPALGAAPSPAATPSVAIIIPTKNQACLLETCVESIRRVTAYPPELVSFVVIDNGSTEPEAMALLQRLEGEPRVTVLRDPRPFNYASLNNQAARAATADVLVFLNNDTEAADPHWLARLAGWAAQPDVGVVGPKLLYPDGTVQHGGVVLGIAGVAGHSFVGIPGDHGGYMGLSSVTREVAALTGACIAVRRAVFEQVGGLREALEIAFNDTVLCADVLLAGYRNLYVGDVSLIHHESKTRGFDDTPEKLARFRHECQVARSLHRGLFDADPFYNPNLALFRPYQPSIPRAARPWRRYRRRVDGGLRVLILSEVNAVGHGVPVVIKQQAEALAAAGCTVFVGGTLSANEVQYEGCLRVYFHGPGEAQSFAWEAEVDCVISHTIPYFTMFRSMGAWPKRVIFDHGEPPPAFFPEDRKERETIDAEKQFCYRIADLVLTNTATVRDEIGFPAAEVAGLGNSHLATWDAAKALRREAIRARHGWTGKVVVLNVSRFHAPERQYKGIDGYVALRRALDPAEAGRFAFVLAGKGTDEDRQEMEAAGLDVFASVPDATLAELYIAADLYVNFSRWEGFNLGIAQALAMGLPVIASDIPAHRAFPIETSDDPAVRAERLHAATALVQSPGYERVAVLMPWRPLTDWLHERLVRLCAE